MTWNGRSYRPPIPKRKLFYGPSQTTTEARVSQDVLQVLLAPSNPAARISHDVLQVLTVPGVDCHQVEVAALPSIVAYWRLGETGGTNANDEIGANDGTYTAGYTLDQASLLPGDSNPSVLLTRGPAGVTAGRIIVPHNAAFNYANGPQWWKIRFQRNSLTPGGSWMELTSKGTQFTAYFNDSQELVVDNDADVAAHTDPILDFDEHELIWTKGNGTVTSEIYLDGRNVTVVSTARTFASNTDPVSIGGRAPITFDGRIDEVATGGAHLVPDDARRVWYSGGVGCVSDDDRNGSADPATATTAAAASGRKNGKGSATAASAATSPTASGRKQAHGTAAASAAASPTGSGRKAAHGTATAATATTGTTASGRKGAKGVASASAATTTEADGHLENVTGSASASAVTSTTASGRKQAHGIASASATASATGTGHGDRHGAATAATATTGTTASGRKGAKGVASASAATTTEADGHLENVTGSASASAVTSTTASGRKQAHGIASASATASATASGRRSASGTASASAATTATGSGSKQGHGVASQSTATAPTAAGTKHANGTVEAEAETHTSAHGGQDESANGSATVSAVTSTAASGRKGARGAAAAATHASSVSATGRKLATGRATVTIVSASSSTGTKGARGAATLFVGGTCVGSGRGHRHGSATCIASTVVTAHGARAGAPFPRHVALATHAPGVTLGVAVVRAAVSVRVPQGPRLTVSVPGADASTDAPDIDQEVTV